MNKLLLIILLFGGGALWRDSGGEIVTDRERYKLEYSGAIGNQTYGNSTSQHAPGKKSLPTNKIARNSPSKPTPSKTVKSTFLAAGISFPQGAFSVRVVRERVANQTQKPQVDRSSRSRLEGRTSAAQKPVK